LSFYENEQPENGAVTYEGLDTMRVVASFGVVFLHVSGSTGVPDSMEWMVRLRDFAVPFLILSSFFVLTLSLDRKSEKQTTDFGRFFSRRFTRIFLPLFIWTFFYLVFSIFLIPLAMGGKPLIENFSPVVFLTGYRHLWYLQFVFLGSLLVYPLVLRLLKKRPLSRSKIFIPFAVGAVFYVFYDRFDIPNQVWLALGAEADFNLQIFAEQVSRYFIFIPLGIGLGLASRSLNEWFSKPLFRKLVLCLAVVAMLAHVRASTIPATQLFYGLAVFLAALLPWKRVPYGFWKKLVDYSYGIYILHFFWAQLVWHYVVNFNPEIRPTTVLAAALLVYALSFGTAVVIRKMMPADWLLPLVGEKPPPPPPFQILRFSLINK